MESERRVTMKLERHADKPWRNDHMNFRTNWSTLAEDFQFPMNKMIRFQMVGTTVDPAFEGQLFNGPVPLVAVFDVC